MTHERRAIAVERAELLSGCALRERVAQGSHSQMGTGGPLLVSTEQTTTNKWRPIETAPKDGTWILAFVPATQRTHSLQWDVEFEFECYDGSEDDGGNAVYRGAWTDHAVASFGYEETKEYTPTHWMPLPEPPR